MTEIEKHTVCMQMWHLLSALLSTLPTAEILSGKNALAWVSMVLYLKKINQNQNIKMKKSLGSRLEVAC